MKRRGIVTFVFDDGYRSLYEHVMPWLTEQDLKATFAVPLKGGALTQELGEEVLPWQTWKNIESSGHEIAAHGLTHSDLTILSDESLEEELQEPAQLLSASTLVYPGGALNGRVEQAAARYYKAARSIRHGFETLPPTDALMLKTYNFSKRNFSVTKANALVLWAYLTGSWLIETYHFVDNTNSRHMHWVSLDEFKRHVLFIKRCPVTVSTVAEVIKSYKL